MDLGQKMKTITDLILINALQSLTSQKIQEAKESDTLYHLYFESPYGLTSCSYSKNSVVKIFYKEQNGA